MNILTMQKRKEEKTFLNFDIPKSLDKEWRAYVAKKYNGYYKGAYTKEIEAALRHFMQHSEGKE
jgi:hypothetical protein